MKKFVCGILLGVLLLSGCRETPDKEAVISKREGISEEAVLEPSSEQKEIQAPELWSDSISQNDGAVYIYADEVPVRVPDIKNTPVTEVERAEFGDEQLQVLVEYFRGDHDMRTIPPMSKAELEVIIKKISDKEGMYGDPDSSVQLNTGSRLSNLKKMLETAPSQKEQGDLISEIKFGEYEEDAYAYTLSGGAEEDLREIFGDDFFLAEVDLGEDVNPRISGTKCDPEKNLTGGFMYIYGGYLSENLLDRELPEKADEWSAQYEQFLQQLQTKLEDMPFEEADAVKEAEKVLADLDIQNMGVGDIEKVFWTPADTRWDSMDVEWDRGAAGYKLEFGISQDGLISYCQPYGTVYQGLGEGVYSPVFSTEKLEMVITEDGMKYFLWKNMSKEKEVIAENTKLLSFEEIVDFLGKHMMAVKVAVDNINGFEAQDSSYVYNILDVQLRSCFMPAYKAPENAWLAPVWVFKTEAYNVDHINGDKEGEKQQEIVVLNAYDGGYISPVQEMDFFS